MQGHVPGPPQPHFPQGLGPFVGYLATREPSPLQERAPEEAGWAADDELYALDQFDDVGDWEPMHRPLIKVLAVIVSFSLVVAGVGTVLELLLSAHGASAASLATTGVLDAHRDYRAPQPFRSVAFRGPHIHHLVTGTRTWDESLASPQRGDGGQM